jgi:hypothetical protein
VRFLGPLLLALGCSIHASPGEADRAAAPAAEPAPASAPTAVSTPAPAPAPAPAPPAGHADLDPTNDFVVGPPAPLPECEQRLADAGVRFEAARIGVGKPRDGVTICGAEQVVRYRSGPGAIAYHKRPLLTCGMALAMADFERIVQEEAERILGERVAKIDHLGTYNCREMAKYDWVSEHSFANAIDLRNFHLVDGDIVSVLDHFRPREPDADDPKTVFLRTVARRLFDEHVFSNVITPYFDELHRNHLHVDLARYRVDGSSP